MAHSSMRLLMAAVVVLAAGAVAGALLCLGPPPGRNPAVFEAEPLRPGVAPLEAAITLGRARIDGVRAAPVLVVGYGRGLARVIDLTGDLPAGVMEPMAAFTALGRDRLTAIARSRASAAVEAALAAFLPTGLGERHVAAGTNFREHADEVAVTGPFLFPKFGPATPAETEVRRTPAALLDYEGEICMRADRAIASPTDFDLAVKGFFLCGDFTERATLTRMVDPSDVGSGRDFSDAKSGPDFFPTGPFLVVPTEWRDFVRAERFTTAVDGAPRQDARGAGMLLDFRAIAERALAGGGRTAWTYRGAPTPLLDGAAPPAGTTITSGTPAGVIYRPPDGREIACGIAAYVCLGGFFSGLGPQAYVIERYLARLSAADHFLRPGQEVRHASRSMGEIVVRVR